MKIMKQGRQSIKKNHSHQKGTHTVQSCDQIVELSTCLNMTMSVEQSVKPQLCDQIVESESNNQETST